MDERACRLCGCTDRFGCEEGCYWVESDLCSVCSGATEMHHRAYTRTNLLRQAASPVPASALAIYNFRGRLLGAAWHISEAQAMARGIDRYYRALRSQADRAQGRQHWYVVTHRARQPIVIGKHWISKRN